MASVRLIVVIVVVSIAVASVAAVSLYGQYGQIPSESVDKIAGKDITIKPAQQQNTDSVIVIPSIYANEFVVPKGTWPNGILVDSKGTIWTVGSKTHDLIAFDPKKGKAKSYPIAEEGSKDETSGIFMVWTMAEGNDGSIWFSGSGKIPLWRFDPAAEKFEAIRSLTAAPIQMKFDKETGDLWFTSLHRGIVGVLQKDGQSSYAVKEVELGKESLPSGIQLGNSSVLWITQSTSGKITAFDIAYDDGGKVTRITKSSEYPEGESTIITPTDIEIYNNSAWVTEHSTSLLTRFDTKTQEMTRYPTALHPIQIVTLPYWMEPAGQNGIWFNEHRGNRIGFFDFSENTLTEYEVPTRNPEGGYIANVLTISADPANENKVWFTELTEDKVGYVDRSVPIPFDIRTADKQIVVEKGQSAQIDIEVTRNPDIQLFNNTLSFNASSSAVPSGVLLNATASFSPDVIDLSKLNGTQTVTFELNDQGIRTGKHMLALSATDGAVIRTVYIQLVIK